MNAITGPMATVARAELASALEILARVSSAKCTVPILGHVVLSGDSENLVLGASNMEMEVAARLQTPGAAGYAWTTHAATLRNMVAAIGGGEVSIGLYRDRMRVQAGQFAASLMTLPESDFPRLQPVVWGTRFTLAADVLRGLLGRLAHAISTEETRYFLNGVYLHRAGDRLVAVATDGHRLVKASAALPSLAGGMPGVIIPREAVVTLLRVLGLGAEPVRVEIAEWKVPRPSKDDPDRTETLSRIKFTVGRWTLDTKTIDGTFPDYERVIPVNKTTATVDRKKLLAAVKRVATVLAERSQPVKLEFAHGTARLSAQDMENGEASDAFQAITESHGEAGFQARYLRAVAEQCGGRMVFAMEDASSPTVIRDEADPHIVFVLMPMRV